MGVLYIPKKKKTKKGQVNKMENKTVDYELCETCEKAMEEAGVVGLTIEEMIKQKAEFDFGSAITFLKMGLKVARKGWNGKDMFLFIVKPTLPHPFNHTDATKDLFINDSICMKTAQNEIVVGWLASQTDMLADDWLITQ